jgi:SAM-dependent methyltransferase
MENPVQKADESLLRWDVRDFGWRIELNNKFNDLWIKKYNLNESPKSLIELAQEGLDTNDSQHHETGWLKNIDKLIDMLPLGFDPSNYHLLDVGCGSGISTLYFADNYKFTSFTGIDFSTELIKIAERNRKTFGSFQKEMQSIHFSVADAKEWKCSDARQMIYMFNPFGFATARSFLNNNLSIFKSTGSILALAWDTWIEQLASEKYHRAIIRNPTHKLSIIAF